MNKVNIVLCRNLTNYRFKAIGALYNRNVTLIKDKLSNITLPDKYKGTVVDKFAKFWTDLIRDYKEVVKDVVVGAKTKPKKASIIVTSLGLFGYFVKNNPDENSFRECVLNHTNEVLLVAKPVRNPAAEQHLVFLETCYNRGMLRRFSFGIFSVMWVDNYDKNLGIYKSSVPYLKPQFTTYLDRIVDIGFLNEWWILSKKMNNFDVNPNEWIVEKSK